MKHLILGILLAGSAVLAAQESPAAYQPIRITFRVLDLDDRPLEGASLAARLDSGSSRVPPDRIIKGKSGADEFSYALGQPSYPVFSNQQHTGPEGRCQIPFIVYSNRSNQPIDYEMMALYNEPNRNILFSNDRHQSLTNADDGRVITIHANVRRQLPVSLVLIALVCWIGGTIMGFLLFFRGLYRYWLNKGRPVEFSRALCYSGTLFISLLTLGLVYYEFLPHIVGLWLFFGVLFVIWLLHFIIVMVTKRQVA